MWTTSLLRVLKSGLINFWRNRWLSGGACGVMVLTLFVITSLFMVNVVANSALINLEDKIDISVYFNLNTNEEQILKIRGNLLKLNEVKTVEYISREDALKDFQERHRDNPLLTQSLEELGKNPLEASLNIKAQQASQYGLIAGFLEQVDFKKYIDKINYRENELVINKLASIIDAIRRVGFGISLVLALIALLVTFNTIRLTIYTARDEVGVMRLVGAGNWYIRGTFLVEGVIYGALASVITLFIFYPLTWSLAPKITSFLPGSDIFYYFKANLGQIFAIQFLIGMGLGIISSLIAIRRYLKV